jgi:hypothetical protein
MNLVQARRAGLGFRTRGRARRHDHFQLR